MVKQLTFGRKLRQAAGGERRALWSIERVSVKAAETSLHGDPEGKDIRRIVTRAKALKGGIGHSDSQNMLEVAFFNAASAKVRG